MNLRTISLITILGACALTAGSSAQRLGPGSFDLSSSTIDGGGGSSTGGAFSLSGTIGQHDASAPMTGGSYQVTGGFWPGIGSAPLTCPADIAPGSGDGLVNIQDLTLVILAWGTADPTADVNHDGIVNIQDLTIVILAWGACP